MAFWLGNAVSLSLIKAWLTIDYVASNTSVLTLVIICFDRYLSGKFQLLKFLQHPVLVPHFRLNMCTSDQEFTKYIKVNFSTEYKNKRIYTQSS